MAQWNDRRPFCTDLDRFIHDDGPSSVGGDRSIRQGQHNIVFLIRKLVGFVCRSEFFIAPERHDQRPLRLKIRPAPQERTTRQQNTPVRTEILIHLFEKVHPCTSKYIFRLYSIKPYFLPDVK